ncbi:N-acetyltransferase [Roseinatronobacter bogoriensis subsp. barguzinensis]|uniref:N-acetyltransferase n=2 Tax=Roseinatronobacter bogoriensis TaxID=119542 RepID=A0A2K8KKN0_9RHOB|nr:N-acetyltransferase [Rhodobaca barguzinensis]
MFNIRTTTPHVPEVAAVIRAHNAFCAATSPAESCHKLTASQLDVPAITLWCAWRAEEVLGIGALKLLDDGAGEVKSMHTVAAARGTGVGRAIVETIVNAARAKHLTRLWLETGTAPQFAAARALYARLGFANCPPFGDYKFDPHSAFYTLALTGD